MQSFQFKGSGELSTERYRDLRQRTPSIHRKEFSMNAQPRMLDIARQHLELMRGRSIEVPRVGGRRQTRRRPLRPNDIAPAASAPAACTRDEARGIALAVIMFAKDANGARMFEDDAETLAALETQVDPAILARIAAEMTRATSKADLGN